MAKYGMSMCVLGMAEEFKDDGVAVNALWPKTGEKMVSSILVQSRRTAVLFASATKKVVANKKKRFRCRTRLIVIEMRWHVNENKVFWGSVYGYFRKR